ncbi:FAD-dependent oxidoreductase [Reticulibacter mediterranei]|uniref:FAD-dependent oxidoreductase n=1 Tax=Reticulibacter mediterranei TaxID=2778369 RepID=A0A8J3N5T9_9CHLR|nr:FAD-dependent monooxygenase [Reticulibacter mediterranei]GHO96730.1 FAD-dependent oxidoreductase [Reticulibacter mediterranei]
MSSYDRDATEKTQVLIVGGGLVGLSTAMFLANQGIASQLIERHPGTAIHPRAMGFTPRTMELFRGAGIEEAIRRIEPPIPQGNQVLLVESLMGQEFDRFQENVDSLFIDASSPVHGSAIAQDLLEPVLRTRAEELGADLHFGTELVTFEQDEEGITATVRERVSQRTPTIRARYMVAADGSQSAIRKQLGIGQHGTGSMGHFISAIFEADLMKVFRERQVVMCFLSNEQVAIGSLVPYPGSTGRGDIFRLDMGYDPEEETLADYPEQRCLSLIRAATGIPDLKITLKATLTWEMNALVADRWQQGNIFLVGDAARTQPPSGGLGANTGIAEAHNLAWKLAAVLRGEAGRALLVTYDAERRPVADYTAEQMALLSQQRHSEGSSGITVNIRDVNTGYRYETGAFVHEEGDEQLPLALSPEAWRGEPGTYFPHLVLAQEDRAISTHDLIGSHFVLFAGPDGRRWKEAAQHVKETLHIELASYQVGGEAGDLIESENRFCETCGITSTGAVLIRPDGFIGWRSKSLGESVQQEQNVLMGAISTMLAR